MARRSADNGAANGAAQYVKLESRLVLAAWLNDLFGYGSNKELLADMKQGQEGFDPYGRRYDTAAPSRDVAAAYEQWEKDLGGAEAAKEALAAAANPC